jgi:riboflavin kinase/FMN adenylyltransferase
MICIDLATGLPTDLQSIPATVTALGNFDGVHVGHQALLAETVRVSAQVSTDHLTVAPAVWFFRDPPSDTLRTPPIPHLSTLSDKLRRFSEHGIRYAFLGEFAKLGALSPENFVKELLQKECRTVHAVCGFNFSFGYRGAGTPALLSDLLDGAISVIAPIEEGGIPISSTRIRTLLANGDVRKASELLGHPYTLTATVLHGKELGRTMKFPTANQEFPPLSVIPKYGIYAVEVRFSEDPEALHYGVCNVGLRPTVETSDHANCETFILDYSGDLYGKEIEISFIEHIRDERRMSGIDELRSTIYNDAEAARKILGLPSGL